MAKFKMQLKGGHFAMDLSALLAMVGPALKRGGLAAQAGIMQTSPVKSGTLRRSWTTGEPELSGEQAKVSVGSNVVYARYQNTRTRNAGYVEAGIEAVKEQVRQTIADGVKEAKGQLWVKE